MNGMTQIISMTSKGQFTLPIDVRHRLGLNKIGDTLQLKFNPQDNTVTLTKPVNLSDIQAFVQAKCRAPNGKMPQDIHGWYEHERVRELRQKGVV